MKREGKEVKMIRKFIERLRFAYWSWRCRNAGILLIAGGAKTILKNVEVLINGVDLSDHCRQITIDTSADEVETSAFKGAYKEFQPGLKDATITATLFQDFASGKVDDVLWPLSNTNTAFTVQVSDLDSPGMDPYRMTSRLYGYQPMSGAVGEASTTEVTFRNAASGGVTRITS